jgi:hypothetical protein
MTLSHQKSEPVIRIWENTWIRASAIAALFYILTITSVLYALVNKLFQHLEDNVWLKYIKFIIMNAEKNMIYNSFNYTIHKNVVVWFKSNPFP